MAKSTLFEIFLLKATKQVSISCLLVSIATFRRVVRFVLLNRTTVWTPGWFIYEFILMHVFYSGKAGLLTPFIYYHFLVQRYTSRRNPYTRNMFHELRCLFELYANKPNMPGIIRNLLLLIVKGITKLAPPQVAATPPQQ